jgi:superfamily I DNA/RNA helicase
MIAKSENSFEFFSFEREQYTNVILKCPSRHKVLVAGPGTGKTTLFKKLLKSKNNTLTLTFINSLVEDLSLELYGLSQVRTLHSFAQSQLRNRNQKIKIIIFPKLSKVIKDDSTLLLGNTIDFDYLFHNMKDIDGRIIFYKKRKDYYGYYGYTDVIYALVKYYEHSPNSIPSYDQIVVDEFQDFNKLEVTLIDLLSTKSPVLIVGDDDQALYDFKSANSDFIRQKAIPSSEYSFFTLPYCSRCSKVIVEAVNDVVEVSKNKNYLRGRINKPFIYFDDKDKYLVSQQNQKIVYTHQFAAKMPYFIMNQIDNMAGIIKDKFSTLIISPTRIQSHTIEKKLYQYGFSNIDGQEKGPNDKIILLDGLELILDNRDSNLGWRIIAQSVLKEGDFKNILLKSNQDKPPIFKELIDNAIISDIKKLLAIIRAIRNGSKIDNEKLSMIMHNLNIDASEVNYRYLKNKIVGNPLKYISPAIRKIPIKLTTIQSSKGLSADIVFFTHIDDQYLINDKIKLTITDREICNFIVAITRARKRIYLISSKKERPTFLAWIKDERVEVI